MKQLIMVLALTVGSASLAACGGGGGSASGGTLPVVTPTNTPQTATISGKVDQLAGPLSSSTWNLAAPSGCPTDPTQSCSTYPTPPPSLPAASATPAAGAGQGGVTVYVVSSADTSGVPTAPIATATTAPDGSFSVTVPNSGTYGLIAANGSYNTATGFTSSGYTLAHGSVTIPSASVVLYVDKLSGDEQSAFTALNTDRANASLPALTSDTMAQAAARIAVAQAPGAATCEADGTVPSGSAYTAFGGIGTGETGWADTGATQWAISVNYASPWNSLTAHFVGLAAVYQAATCGANPPSIPVNYYSALYVN